VRDTARASRRIEQKQAERDVERKRARQEERRTGARELRRAPVSRPEPKPPRREAPRPAPRAAAEPTPDFPTDEGFLALGLVGPPTASVAPSALRLPRLLFEQMTLALDAALNDGLEHGGVFGRTRLQPRALTVAPVTGQVHQIDYASAVAVIPAVRQAGTFHTHLWELIDTGDPARLAWAGGAHSDADLVNLLRAQPHMSAVVAQTSTGGRKIFLALRPQRLEIPEGAARFVAGYRRRVIAAVEKGADPVDASERELARLGRGGDLVFYSGLDSPVLSLLIPAP